MKWSTDWNSITIEAETEKDAQLLWHLFNVLPRQAHSFYEDGFMEYGVGQESEMYNGALPGTEALPVLVFSR